MRIATDRTRRQAQSHVQPGPLPDSHSRSGARTRACHKCKGSAVCKDIATIAKEANGAVVSVIMSDKEGHPVVQGSGFLVLSLDSNIMIDFGSRSLRVKASFCQLSPFGKLKWVVIVRTHPLNWSDVSAVRASVRVVITTARGKRVPHPNPSLPDCPSPKASLGGVLVYDATTPTPYGSRRHYAIRLSSVEGSRQAFRKVCHVDLTGDGLLCQTSTIASVTNRNLRNACPSGVSTTLQPCQEIS